MAWRLVCESVKIPIHGSCLYVFSATWMAASSALLIVCLSGCDFTSICVVVCVFGLTMDAPRVGFPVTSEPYV